jgi:hypothetical protein
MTALMPNRAALLASIEATQPPGDPLDDLSDPRLVTSEARVTARARSGAEIFPPLEVALSERFAAVPRQELIEDLFMPLRTALGGSHRPGDGEHTRDLMVEMIVARRGVLIAVSRDGSGIEVVPAALGPRRSRSSVCSEDGGRTLLLCYRPSRDLPARPGPAREPLDGEPIQRTATPHACAPTSLNALDSEWMRACLSSVLPVREKGPGRLESCRVFGKEGRAGSDGGLRYLVRWRNGGARSSDTRILTGRLHATEASAEADFEVATRLRAALAAHCVRIPWALARPDAEPRLVLYDFHPWMNLWEYLSLRRSHRALRRCARRIGSALAALHRCRVALRQVDEEFAEAPLAATVARAERSLQGLAWGGDLLDRFRSCARRLQRSGLPEPRPVAPTHAALGWDSIYYGVDGRFYLYRFETCRRSDPALDLGAFNADLLNFAMARRDEEAYRLGRDAFLQGYLARGGRPIDPEQLGLYTALAITECLRETRGGALARREYLIKALGAA